MNLLFCSSEAYPFVKTGGLADVAGSLPYALADPVIKENTETSNLEAIDVKLVIPAYRCVLEYVKSLTVVSWIELEESKHIRILQVYLEHSGIDLWLVDIPPLFDRPGNPYLNAKGDDWPDNAQRFAVFSKVVAQIAMNKANLDWQADIVHTNDWQTGLVPAYLSLEHDAPKTIFTIHNLAYGGHFSEQQFRQLHLPEHWWDPYYGIEFYSGFSMLKAGIIFSDWVTTVSPTYANEICTPSYGYGFENLLQQKRQYLRGILNGIDDYCWNPNTDRFIPYHYNNNNFITAKRKNKVALLQQHANHKLSKQEIDAPLFSFIGRLVEQKGVDLLLSVIPQILAQSTANFFLVGTGQQYFESALIQLQHHYPDRIYLHIGYSESLAHKVEAASDIFLMPSRFEPCGLNQLYSLRYGTLPLVHATGGLADTVINATMENIDNNTATGFAFYDPSEHALYATIQHILYLYQQKPIWHQLQENAMQQDFSWQKSALTYRQLYQE